MRARFLLGAAMMAAILAAAPAWGDAASLVCLYAGQQYKVGEFACIAACHGERRLARCDAGAATASWTYVSDACPSAILIPPLPAEATERPLTAAMTPIPLPLQSRMSEMAPDIWAKIADLRKVGAPAR
jgi:hypothetical protein